MVPKPSLIAANVELGKLDVADALRDRFLRVRQVTERLAENLSDEDCALQSMADTSPVKWHLAHSSWFFETFLLEKFAPNFKPFDPAFRVLFNSYYYGVGERHPRAERGLISRPSRAKVLDYRHHVTNRIAAMFCDSTNNAVFRGLILLGCHHEQQHQELILTDLKHLLSKNPQRPAYEKRWPLTPVEARQPRWIAYTGGLQEMGHTGADFAFVNECPRHRVILNPFELASHPVTHGDFAAFIADGGYHTPRWWLSIGWEWVQSQRIEAPLYWQPAEQETNGTSRTTWRTFTLRGMVDIDPHTPICHVNYFEADAYARWAGARLPREAEWEFAAATLPVAGNFLDANALHPLALREETAIGAPAQMFGDVWEWTESAYLPYPGFSAPQGAVGEYNGKFMCNQFVLRGGSCVTPADHIRATYRNFFPPDARWQFSGLRLARDVS